MTNKGLFLTCLCLLISTVLLPYIQANPFYEPDLGQRNYMDEKDYHGRGGDMGLTADTEEPSSEVTTQENKGAPVEEAPWFKFCMENMKYYKGKDDATALPNGGGGGGGGGRRRRGVTYDKDGLPIDDELVDNTNSVRALPKDANSVVAAAGGDGSVAAATASSGDAGGAGPVGQAVEPEEPSAEFTTQPNEDTTEEQAPWRRFCMENMKYYNKEDNSAEPKISVGAGCGVSVGF